MNLADVSIRRPIFIFMVILAVVVLGLTSFFRLPIDLFPNVEFPYVTVMTVYAGASPREVETQITEKIEDELSAVSDLKSMDSKSMESVSIVTCEFEPESDVDDKVADVREKMDSLKSELPDDAEDSVILKLDLNSFPIIFASVSAPRPEGEVREMADDVIKPLLEKIPGVANISIFGGKEREIHVDVDREKLFAYNLSILQVIDAIGKDNVNYPVGKIKKGTEESVVRVIGEYASVDELANLDIQTPMGTIKLRDIADVTDSYKDKERYSRLLGSNSVGISISKQSGSNTVKVSNEVQKVLDEMVGTYVPDDYNVELVMDLSRFIKESLNDVKTSLMYGAIFATLMIMLFLRSGSATFIIFLAIPTAIIGTFMPIYSAGFTLNFMSLMGLAIAVGTLVDNSVVVLENIFRHLEMGKNSREAARDGVAEVGLAVLASGTTNICVYLPVAFMTGTTGQFFKEFGFAVAFATALSIFVAFTLTPAVSSRILKYNGKNGNGNIEDKSIWVKLLTVIFFPVIILFKYLIFPGFDICFNALKRVYPKAIYFCLKWRWVTVSIIILLFVSAGAILQMKLVGFEFVPEADAGEFDVMVEMPTYASLDDTDKVVRVVEDLVSKIEEVDAYFAVSGMQLSGTTSQSNPQYGFVIVRLVDFDKRDRSTQQIMQQIRKQVARIPDATFQVVASSMGGPPGQLPLSVEVRGPDIDKLVPVAEEVYGVVQSVEGVIDLNTSWDAGKSEIQILMDKEKMARMGLDVATTGYTMRVSLEGDDSLKYKEHGEEYDIRIRFGGEDKETIEDILGIPILTQQGAVRLGNIAKAIQKLGPNTLERTDGVPTIAIEGNLDQRAIGDVQNDIMDKVAEMDLPEGYEVKFGGDSEEMGEMMGQMITAMVLAVLFVYMVMAAQFESLFYPFVVMFTLPLTFIGVVWSLFLTGNTMNMMSMIGMVMLIGIVVNNGIILIDFVNQIRDKGKARNNAIIRAGILRLRPILITSLTTICGMLPSVLLAGSGGGFRRPMAIVAVGGMVVSTALTLLFIPVIYSLMDDIIKFAARLVTRKPKEDVWGDMSEIKALRNSGGDITD